MISHAMKIQFLRRWRENEGNSNCCCEISSGSAVLLKSVFRGGLKNNNNHKAKEQ